MKKLLAGGALALALVLAASSVWGQQVWRWSTTSGTNASADPAINWAEGMSPSSVNDSARAMMAALAKYRDDVGGRLTTGGSSTAYTLTSNSSYASTPANGTKIAFTPHATNGASATLVVDSGTAFPIRVDASNAVPAASLVAGSPYVVVFNSTASAWVLHGYFGQPTTVPIGGIIDYVGSTVPNSNFAFANGQAISRTTYSALFAITGTTFGSGDGTTTFNLPDLRGRMVAGLDNMGGVGTVGRISVAGGNFNGATLGATGGLQNHTLTTAEMPTHLHSISLGTSTEIGDHAHGVSITTSADGGHTPTINVSDTRTWITGATFVGSAGGAKAATAGGSAWGEGHQTTVTVNSGSISATANAVSAHTHTVAGATSGASAPHTHNVFGNTGNNGSGTAHTVLSPTMVLPKIIRIF